MTLRPSKFQTAIYDFLENGSGHGIVNAVAGSGKTYTILTGLKYISGRAIFLAFNKSIATELQRRCPSNVECSTLHSAGLKIITSNIGRCKINGQKIDTILDEYQPTLISKMMNKEEKGDKFRLRMILKKLVGLIKNTLTDYTNHSDIQQLADYYDIDYFPEHLIMLQHIIEKSLDITINKKIIDFDDMIWLPVILNHSIKNQYDWVFVDETQDLNKSQLELVLKLISVTGRIVAVGDPKQSIYGFRGADVDAMDRIKNSLNAKEFPLSVCYRCPTSHIELVKYLVPQIESKDDAIEGIVESITDEEFIDSVTKETNPLILSRVNSLCTKFALQLISKGYKAVIKGRDFGQGLINQVKKFNARTIDSLYEKTTAWKDTEIKKLENRNAPQSKIDLIYDKYDTLLAIYDNCDSVECVITTLFNLFSDDNTNNAFTFSTTHKAKGLEADTVYILAPNMFPLIRKNQLTWEYEQELNIKYVTYTRSKNKLVEVIIKKR